MKNSVVALASSVVLALGLTVPVWAQIGRAGIGAGARGEGNVGLGHSDLSSTTHERGDLNAKTGPNLVSGSTRTSGSTKESLKTSGKTKVKANSKAGASANARVKKQGKHGKVKVDAGANANADVNAHTSADLR